MNNNYFGGIPNPNVYNEQMARYQNLMNQYQNMMAQQQPMQNGNYKPVEKLYARYVDNYEEVEKAQVPMDGSVTMFFTDKVFWTKKIVNGQPYINAYYFNPINSQGEPSSSNENGTQDINNQDVLKSIVERLEKLERSINTNNESK